MLSPLSALHHGQRAALSAFFPPALPGNAMGLAALRQTVSRRRRSSGEWKQTRRHMMKNISAVEITFGSPSRHVCVHHCEQLRMHPVSVFDSNPAAESPDDRNALAQVATGSGLLLLASHQR